MRRQLAEVLAQVSHHEKMCASEQNVKLTLNNGVLTDAQGRTGYIAANRQLQFDNPPQAGALITSGFSVCEGHLLSLSSSPVWQSCASGNFSNIYDKSIGGQCMPINLVVVPWDDSC